MPFCLGEEKNFLAHGSETVFNKKFYATLIGVDKTMNSQLEIWYKIVITMKGHMVVSKEVS